MMIVETTVTVGGSATIAIGVTKIEDMMTAITRITAFVVSWIACFVNFASSVAILLNAV